MVAGPGVHAPPPDLLLQHPVQRIEIGARVIAEVFHEVLLRLTFVMAVPAGMQNEDVALANIRARRFDHRWRAWPRRNAFRRAMRYLCAERRSSASADSARSTSCFPHSRPSQACAHSSHGRDRRFSWR